MPGVGGAEQPKAPPLHWSHNTSEPEHTLPTLKKSAHWPLPLQAWLPHTPTSAQPLALSGEPSATYLLQKPAPSQ